MTEKRYYYNTFYHPELNNRKEFEIVDRESETGNIEDCWYFYIDENDSHWEDMVVDRLNEQDEEINKLLNENQQLKEKLNNFEFSYTENKTEFYKDKLYVRERNTEIDLKEGNIIISVFIPQINEIFRIKYLVTGRTIMREYIE